jgi:glycosyltransferase involved in cell wall biosynthesis
LFCLDNGAEGRLMKFGFVTLGANVPSTRFRFLPYLEPLKLRGHHCRLWNSFPPVYDYFPTIGWRASSAIKTSVRWWQYQQAKWFQPDTIYLERGCFHDATVWLDERFRKLAPRLVLDVDDGVFLNFPDKIRHLIEISDHVVVSNQNIYRYAEQFGKPITEIPTCVSLQRYPLRRFPENANRKVVIGWIGTSPNLRYLETCSKALRRLSKEREVELLVVAPQRQLLDAIDLTGVTLRFEPWSPQTEIQLLHEMDIGIMPLVDDQEWTKYKAATKLVQYMALGIAAVASPVGVNAEILKDNRVGMAAANDDEWFDCLRTLVDDAELRRNLGIAGRALVESRYCIEANLSLLESVLCGTAG